MKVITLAFSADGKPALLHGPELNATEHRKARFAAREGKLPAGVVRLETYALDVRNRLGVAVPPASASGPVKPAKPAKADK